MRRRFRFTFVVLALAWLAAPDRADALELEILKARLTSDLQRLRLRAGLSGFTPDLTSDWLITLVVRNEGNGEQAAASVIVNATDPASGGPRFHWFDAELAGQVERLDVRASMAGFTLDPAASYLVVIVIRNETNGEQASSWVIVQPNANPDARAEEDDEGDH